MSHSVNLAFVNDIKYVWVHGGGQNRAGQSDKLKDKQLQYWALLVGSSLVWMSTESWQLCGPDMNLCRSSSPDNMEEEKLNVSSRESPRVICLQVLPSYLLAGLGMVMAGMLLDQVQVSASGITQLCDTSTDYMYVDYSRTDQRSSAAKITINGKSLLYINHIKKGYFRFSDTVRESSSFLLDNFQRIWLERTCNNRNMIKWYSHLEVRLLRSNKVTIYLYSCHLSDSWCLSEVSGLSCDLVLWVWRSQWTNQSIKVTLPHGNKSTLCKSGLCIMVPQHMNLQFNLVEVSNYALGPQASWVAN